MNQKFLLATFPLGYRRDTDNYCFYGLWTVELKGVLLHYPHPPEPVSAPDKEERMVQAARMQADKQCRMQGQQPMVLHVTLSGPGTEAKPVPEQLWPHPAVTKLSGRVPALPGQEHSHQGREVAFEWGLVKEWHSSLCWVRGREEGIRHSKRWNNTKFLRLSGYRKAGYIALSNKQMASRESKAH